MKYDEIESGIKKVSTELVKRDKDGDVFEVIIRDYEVNDEEIELVSMTKLNDEKARKYINNNEDG